MAPVRYPYPQGRFFGPVEFEDGGEAAVQLRGEHGERYVDHRRIELRKKRANHSNRRDLPDQRV